MYTSKNDNHNYFDFCLLFINIFINLLIHLHYVLYLFHFNRFAQFGTNLIRILKEKV